MISIMLNLLSFSLFLLADGSTSQSVYTGKSSTASEYEIHCSCSYDTFFNYRRLGRWFLLRKSKSCESYVRKIGLYQSIYFVHLPRLESVSAISAIVEANDVYKMDLANRNLYILLFCIH
jgi:hypothetical protein